MLFDVYLEYLTFQQFILCYQAEVAGGMIDSMPVAAVLDKQDSKWGDLPNGKNGGLLLSSGDMFNPSVESSVMQGSHW